MSSDKDGLFRKIAGKSGLIFGLLLFLVFLGVFRHFGEGQKLLELIKDAGGRWLFLALVLQAGTYFCYAATWHAALRRTATPVKFLDLLPLSIAKLFTDQAAPSAGLGGAFLVMESLANRKVSRHAAVGALLVGLAGYYIAYALLFGAALIILASYGTLRKWMLLTAGVFGIVVLILATLVILFWSGVLIEKLPKRLRNWERLKPFFDAMEEVPEHFERDWKLLAEAGIFSAGIFLLDAATLWVILKALHVSFGTSETFASFMIAAVASTIGMIPGGLGVFEGSETGALVFFGLPFEAAFAATLILRGFTYWLPMLPGLLVVRHELKKHREAAGAAGLPN